MIVWSKGTCKLARHSSIGQLLVVEPTLLDLMALFYHW